jgi:hypothetical protein
MVTSLLVSAGVWGGVAGPTPLQARSSDTGIAGGIAVHQRSVNGQLAQAARMPGAPASADDAAQP